MDEDKNIYFGEIYLPIVERIVFIASWVAFTASLRTPSEQEARESIVNPRGL